MDVGTKRFDQLYNVSHRLLAASLVLYAVMAAFSREQVATFIAGFLFLVLVPVVVYTYVMISRGDYDTLVPFSAIILVLSMASLSWVYFRLVERIENVPALIPMVLIGIAALLTFTNSKNETRIERGC